MRTRITVTQSDGVMGAAGTAVGALPGAAGRAPRVFTCRCNWARGRLLPLQGSRAQDRGDRLTLSRNRADCLPLQGAVVRQVVSRTLEVRLCGASWLGRFPLELVDTLGHARQATPQLTVR